MKRNIVTGSMAASVLVVSVLAGCEPREVVERVRTVDWYASHDTERAEQLAQCKTNPALLDATPNCVNASRAENRVQAATKWATENDEVRTPPPIIHRGQ